MKKLLLTFLSVFMLFNLFCVNTYASSEFTSVEYKDNSVIYTYIDGSQLITFIEDVEDDMSTRATSTNITKTKTVRYKDSDGIVLWEYVLTAKFSYIAGVSATCTSASYTYTINKDSWHFSDGVATKSNNVATGAGTFKNKVLFITTKTVDVDISLTCDVNGNVT